MQTIFDIDTACLRGAGMIEPNLGWHMQTHSHTHWEFIYFLRGRGRVNLPFTTLCPRHFHLLIYYPGLPHAETADPLDPEETIFLCVDVHGTPPPDMPILLADPRGELRWLCEHIYQECHGYPAITPLAHTYTRAFLQLIERNWQTTKLPSPDPVQLAIQYLDTNYAREISMESLAAMANITPTHLIHCFTSRIGISPMQYLKFLRIEAAKQLLATTEMTVNEIALRVGYADNLYFRRVFKAVAGHTPSECRRKG